MDLNRAEKLLDEIERLNRLHVRGVLTDPEFAAKKRSAFGDLIFGATSLVGPDPSPGVAHLNTEEGGGRDETMPSPEPLPVTRLAPFAPLERRRSISKTALLTIGFIGLIGVGFAGWTGLKTLHRGRQEVSHLRCAPEEISGSVTPASVPGINFDFDPHTMCVNHRTQYVANGPLYERFVVNGTGPMVSRLTLSHNLKKFTRDQWVLGGNQWNAWRAAERHLPSCGDDSSSSTTAISKIIGATKMLKASLSTGPTQTQIWKCSTP